MLYQKSFFHRLLIWNVLSQAIIFSIQKLSNGSLIIGGNSQLRWVLVRINTLLSKIFAIICPSFSINLIAVQSCIAGYSRDCILLISSLLSAVVLLVCHVLKNFYISIFNAFLAFYRLLPVDSQLYFCRLNLFN